MEWEILWVQPTKNLIQSSAGHPFDTLKVRLQTEGVHGRFTGLWDCIVKTAKEEGLVRGKIFRKNLIPFLRFI